MIEIKKAGYDCAFLWENHRLDDIENKATLRKRLNDIRQEVGLKISQTLTSQLARKGEIELNPYEFLRESCGIKEEDVSFVVSDEKTLQGKEIEQNDPKRIEKLSGLFIFNALKNNLQKYWYSKTYANMQEYQIITNCMKIKKNYSLEQAEEVFRRALLPSEQEKKTIDKKQLYEEITKISLTYPAELNRTEILEKLKKLGIEITEGRLGGIICLLRKKKILKSKWTNKHGEILEGSKGGRKKNPEKTKAMLDIKNNHSELTNGVIGVQVRRSDESVRTTLIENGVKTK